MKSRNIKKGFTLVELLAVIVILAIILAIAIPSITTMVNKSTRNAFEIDAAMILKIIDYKMMEDSSFNPTEVNETNVKEKLNIDDSNYQTLTVKKINGVIHVTIVGKNKWDNLTVSGTKIVTNVGDTQTSFSNGANAPVLATGMTPIKWDGSAWVDTTPSDTSWYNYDTVSKIWANARTADGSMWVWIPRYIYKISTGWHASTTGTIDIQFTKGIDDNWNKASIGAINLDETANASNNTWTNHPAFTFGSTELTGIWVAKFEVTAAEGVANGYTGDGSCPTAGDNVTTKTISSVPNAPSWRCISISNMFTNTRNIETNSVYGWGTTGTGIDTHLIKNIEWGAVAYLSRSVYGKNDEIWVNNSNTFTTGCAGDSSSDTTSTTGCEYAYNTTSGLQASTTGNIYGIYDMSGGALEYVAAYINNDNYRLISEGSSLIGTANQYKDIYEVGSVDNATNNYALAINHKGDAMYETGSSESSYASWYSDYSFMPATFNPWFMRGGGSFGESYAGVFGFIYVWGGPYGALGFRPVLAVNVGL